MASQNETSSYLWMHSKDFLKILLCERSQEVHESYTNPFSKKVLAQGEADPEVFC